jgi:antitoxin (DNA-binding transcriptional repressor) of toxin-antitoxin stability system
MGYEIAMKPVNVAELKNRLSHYLRLVRRGQAVLVRDRDRVIARIEPAGGRDATAGEDTARLADLEARGILRRGHGHITPDLWARRPATDADAVAALLGERDDGR